MIKPLVFGIGLNKTGTRSLVAALRILGYRAWHDAYPGDAALRLATLEGRPLLTYLPNYDAFADNPFPKYFRQLDAQYPGSRFILTVRDVESWILSRSRHVQRNLADPNYRGNWRTIDPEAWRQEWHRHVDAVRAHFSGRDNLLIFDVRDGWEQLCAFLNEPIPDVSFPHEGRTTGSPSPAPARPGTPAPPASPPAPGSDPARP